VKPEAFVLPIVFIGLITFAIVIWNYLEKQRRKRLAELTALAQNLNFVMLEEGIPMGNSIDLLALLGFSAPAPPSAYSADFLSFFPLFNSGSSRRIAPAIVGSDQLGNNWYLFEYRYTVSSGKNTTTYHFTVVIVQAPIVFPSMSLASENVLFSVGKFLGVKELQVESEEFNQRYFIKTTDEKMSLDLLHPIAIEALMRQPSYEWQFSGPFAMLHVTGGASVDQMGQMKTCIQEFLNQIPTYYRQDFGSNRTTP
jgi:hypothetical protein